MRLLVIEDQRKMASFIKKGLSETGYSVDLAETGSAGESLASENDYDLIILDVMLPDQSGLDTARHLRQEGYCGPDSHADGALLHQRQSERPRRRRRRLSDEAFCLR